MHDKDPNVYPFADWGSPQGQDYRSTLFLLPGVAGLSGGTLRIPNSFLTQVAGGRNVVYSTSILLCIPMVIAGIVLSDSDCPFNALIACAMLSGVGGGAFASSMSNISFYYPKRLQGMALGYNGGLGNLGVSISQLLAPIVMTTSYGRDPVSPAGVSGWPANVSEVRRDRCTSLASSHVCRLRYFIFRRVGSGFLCAPFRASSPSSSCRTNPTMARRGTSLALSTSVSEKRSLCLV